MNEIEKSYQSLVRIFGNPLSDPNKIEKAVQDFEKIIVTLKMVKFYLEELEYLQRHDVNEKEIRISSFQRFADADYLQSKNFMHFLERRGLVKHNKNNKYIVQRLSVDLDGVEFCVHNDFIHADIYGHEIKVCRQCNHVLEYDFYTNWQDMGPFDEYLAKIRTEKILKKVNDGLDAQNSDVPARKVGLG